MAEENEFLAGVIEGFYGPPWSESERFQLFDWLKAWGLNTYFYAPKDDLKHRALWRELYSDEEAQTLRKLITQCEKQGLRFIYGIAPLDIRYSDDSEIALLKIRIDQMATLGCRDFALLFDDIPDQLNDADARRFKSFARAQCHVANTLFGFLPENGRFLFCPTAYCGRMAAAKLGGQGYLSKIGEGLAKEIDVLWTGPEIISQEITIEDARSVRRLLRRKPVIWDNLHANDYDSRRFFCGPYSGRSLDLRNEVRGILSNPNCEFPLNYIPIRTLANFVKGKKVEPRDQYVSAMKEWHSAFDLVRGNIPFDFLLLLGDCFYLPYEHGMHAERLLVHIKHALLEPERLPMLTKLKEMCSQLSMLKNRHLFYALNRRIWDLREELDLLERCLANSGKATHSDYHLPNTFRGGFISKLQTLLKSNRDGSFAP